MFELNKMNRSRSAAPFTTVPVEDIRGVSKKIAPYIVHQWRDVCEELGVSDEDLDRIEVEADKSGTRRSETAFQGLALWFEKAGRAASKDKLLRVVQGLGLRRAEDELRRISQKNTINALARPVTAIAQVSQQCEIKLNKQQKQKGKTCSTPHVTHIGADQPGHLCQRNGRQQTTISLFTIVHVPYTHPIRGALADRLSRPKSHITESTAPKPPPAMVSARKKPDHHNNETQQPRPINKNELCEVKLKITVSGVQRPDQSEIQSTRDDFQSTKNDYKHTCHTFVKIVMAKQNEHFRTLKRLLGFSGISMQRMNRMGFNINCFILCSSLGSFEILYQAYKSGRLKRICQTVFITSECLEKLNASHVDLSVQIEDGMVNEYRDVLLLRGLPEHPEQVHPADYLKLPERILSLVQNDVVRDKNDEKFELRSWQKSLRFGIDNINYRFQSFNDNALEFMRTLRIVKPDENKPVSCLNVVISYLRHLRNSHTLASGVRIDLIREFLAIVNQVRLKYNQIQQNEAQVSFDILLSSDGCELFHSYLEQLEAMLKPDYIFKPNDTLLTHSLSVLEKDLYANLLTHIPSLLSVLFALSDSLTLLRTDEEIHRLINYEEPTETEQDEENEDKKEGMQREEE